MAVGATDANGEKRMLAPGPDQAYNAVMRTTLDLPADLIEEAKSLLGLHNKTEVVVAALRELVRARKREGLKDLAGQVDVELDIAASRRRPSARGSA